MVRKNLRSISATWREFSVQPRPAAPAAREVVRRALGEHLRNEAEIGSESRDLRQQIAALATANAELQVVVIIVGGNERMRMQSVGASVGYLFEAVRDLRQMGCDVVVATCPDMGTVLPFDQP